MVYFMFFPNYFLFGGATKLGKPQHGQRGKEARRDFKKRDGFADDEF